MGKRLQNKKGGEIMKCSYCGNEMLETTTTHVEEMGGNTILVIKGVPCYKCKECSEIHYTMDVLMKLEALVNKFKETLSTDMIVEYSVA